MSDGNKNITTPVAATSQGTDLPAGYTEQDVDGVLEANYLAAVLVGLARQEAWENMSDEEQFDLLSAAVKSSSKRRRGFKDEHDDRVAEAWLDMAKRFQNYEDLLYEDQIRRFQGKKFRDLESVSYNAANSTAERDFRKAEKIKENETTDHTQDEDGNEIDIISKSSSVESFEKNLLLRDMLEDVLPKVYAELDDTNKMIFTGMANGISERKIAEVVSLSHSAVHKRIMNIRQRLIDAGLER